MVSTQAMFTGAICNISCSVKTADVALVSSFCGHVGQPIEWQVPDSQEFRPVHGSETRYVRCFLGNQGAEVGARQADHMPVR